jgi:hypothetical protein
MKKLLMLTISLAVAFQVMAQQAAKTYAVKSGKIEYKLSGSTNGTKTIYFDNYGNKYFEHEKSVTETKIFGITDRSKTDKITIINNNHFWTIDHIDKKYYEGEMPYTGLAKQMAEGMTDAEIKELSNNILASFGGKQLGTEKILGYNCEKIEIMGSLIWVYKGISLKTKTDVMGVVVNENAVSFNENINISAGKFKAPPGIKFINIEAQKQSMYGNMNFEDYEEEEEEDIVAVTYPFQDFKNEINTFNPEGYSRMMVMNQDGQHVAIYTKGMSNVVSVMATAEENMEFEGDMSKFETFTHKGKTMHYGDLSEDDMDGKALVIPYQEHNMYIILMSTPGKDKNTLLKWADELDF